MSSQHIRPLLSAYVDGKSTPAERRQVEDHLVRCAECAAVLAEYRAIGSNVRACRARCRLRRCTAMSGRPSRPTGGAAPGREPGRAIALGGRRGDGSRGGRDRADRSGLKPQTVAGVQMTRPANGQTNVGINSPVILHFDPAVTDYAKDQVRVSTNVDARTVYSTLAGCGDRPGAGTDLSARPDAGAGHAAPGLAEPDGDHDQCASGRSMRRTGIQW